MRLKLTPTEREFLIVCKNNISANKLKANEVRLLNSIYSQYDFDGCLSAKQLKALRDLKSKSDRAKRSAAIQKGRLDPSWKDRSRIEDKLNTIYNKIGR